MHICLPLSVWFSLPFAGCGLALSWACTSSERTLINWTFSPYMHFCIIMHYMHPTKTMAHDNTCSVGLDARSFWAQVVKFAATPGGTRPPAKHDELALESFRKLSNAWNHMTTYMLYWTWTFLILTILYIQTWTGLNCGGQGQVEMVNQGFCI